MPTYLCRLDELPDGGARGFDSAGPRPRHACSWCAAAIGVHVWRNACPHHGTPMAWRKDAYLNAAGNRIVCYGHGALFEIDTGVCIRGPCVGQALTPVSVERDADGALWIPAGAAPPA